MDEGKIVLCFLFKSYEEFSESIQPGCTAFNDPSLRLVAFHDVIQILALVPDVWNVSSLYYSSFNLGEIVSLVQTDVLWVV